MTSAAKIYAGGRIKASDIRNVAPLAAYKAADESISTGVGTLQPDDALLLVLTANTVYEFDLILHYSGGAQGASDLRVAWTYPAGTTMRYTPSGLDTTGAAAVGGYTTETTALTFGTSGSGKRSVRMGGTISVGATPGTLQLMWCQNSGTATATAVLSGSKLTAVQIS